MSPRKPIPLSGLFVDKNSNAVDPDGKSWEKAFKTIAEAVAASVGQNIYVAAGVYESPDLDLTDKSNIHLIGGYKSGELYEKNTLNIKDDEWATLDGKKKNTPLVKITGDAQNISFSNGFKFQNVSGNSAVMITGTNEKPVKNISINRVRFLNNQGENGAGLFIKNAKKIRLEDLFASENKASNQGGFLNIADSDQIIILRGNYESNEAEKGGAFALTNLTNLDLSGQTLKRNKAKNGGGGYLKDIKNQVVSRLNFENNFTERQPGHRGGGLYIENCKDLIFYDLNYRNNISFYGGGLFVTASENLTFHFSVSELKNNQANDGGAIYIKGSKFITIDGGKGSNNKGIQGGFIAVVETINFTAKNMVLDKNEAENIGAGFYLEELGGKVLIENVDIKNGISRAYAGDPGEGIGGGLYIEGTNKDEALVSLGIVNTRFVGNSSAANGGAIFASEVSYPIVFKNTLFENNSAKGYGGALVLDANTDRKARFIIDEGSKFYRNRSDMDDGGGGIFIVLDDAQIPPAKNLVFSNVFFENIKNNSSQNNAGSFMRVTTQGIGSIDPADASNLLPDLVKKYIDMGETGIKLVDEDKKFVFIK